MYEMNGKKTDEELVKLSKGGDKRATEELLLRHFGLVRGLARGFFLVGGETEDLIQEGMIGLYNAIEDYKDTGKSFKNLAYLCVSRRIIDAVKASARRKNNPLNGGVSMEVEEEWADASLSPEELLIINDDRREFRQKMSGVLSDFEFKVTTMYMDGMSYAEICHATGKGEKSVENAIQRSKKKLQNVFKKD
jgi:RNA polymerase sporulation-specific sigma factor